MSSSWSLIYHTDASGVPVFGSLQEFRGAVLAGADVKILYSPGTNVWWSRNCSSINVMRSGASTVIAATFMEAADTRVSGSGGGLEFEEPFALEYHIYNTTGVRVVRKFNYQNHAPLPVNTVSTVAMKWFVKDYALFLPWRLRPDAIITERVHTDDDD
jgi:hypothetical protein